MIEVTNLQKSFGEIKAVDGISATIAESHVFGLIGTNGADKSTFLRLLCGVLKPEGGSILIDGEPVYDQPKVKEKIFYISDDQYFFKSGTPMDMFRLYESFYPQFDRKRALDLMGKFGLDKDRKVNTFSKGMKKQLSVICGVCANTKYLLCDETFDGLDPVMRQAVKAIFIQEIEERGMTPIIASHNLRELEDICEYVGLLHRGGILLEKDLDEMKMNIHKVQCVLRKAEDIDVVKEHFAVLNENTRGNLKTITLRGERPEVEALFAGLDPIFYELLPLSLEEIFISETEVKGYDVKTLFG